LKAKERSLTRLKYTWRVTGEITKDEYVIPSKTINPHRACRDQARKVLYKTVYMYTLE
jgi:hypothetical protein